MNAVLLSVISLTFGLQVISLSYLAGGSVHVCAGLYAVTCQQQADSPFLSCLAPVEAGVPKWLTWDML